MTLKFLQQLGIFFLCASTVYAMDDAPEPMDIEETSTPLFDDLKEEPESMLLRLPGEVQVLIFKFVAMPTFAQSDWIKSCGQGYDPKRLLNLISKMYHCPDKSIKEALTSCASSCKKFHDISYMILKNKEEYSCIKKQYTVEKIAQVLREALKENNLSVGDLIFFDPDERHRKFLGYKRVGYPCYESVFEVASNIKMSVLHEAACYDSVDFLQIILLAADDAQKLVLYKNNTDRTALHYAAAYCRKKEIFRLLFTAAGDKAKELLTMRDTFEHKLPGDLARDNSNFDVFPAAVYEFFGDDQPDNLVSADIGSGWAWCIIV